MGDKILPNLIILFDGVCNLCNSSVQWIIKNDPDGIFKFASMQSEAGQRLLRKFNLPTDDYHSFILIEGDKYYSKSDAALRVAKRLDGIPSSLYAFMIMPKPVRDFLYNRIAKNRYSWFGKKDECMIPTPELESRFLE